MLAMNIIKLHPQRNKINRIAVNQYLFDMAKNSLERLNEKLSRPFLQL